MTEPYEPTPDLAPDSKMWAILAHLLPLIGSSFIAPLIIYLIKKDEDAFVAHHAREALNFQISLIIYGVVAAILILVIIGIFLLIALGIAALILAIVAAVAASNEQMYRYPMILRLVT